MTDPQLPFLWETIILPLDCSLVFVSCFHRFDVFLYGCFDSVVSVMCMQIHINAPKMLVNHWLFFSTYNSQQKKFVCLKSTGKFCNRRRIKNEILITCKVRNPPCWKIQTETGHFNLHKQAIKSWNETCKTPRKAEEGAETGDYSIPLIALWPHSTLAGVFAAIKVITMVVFGGNKCVYYFFWVLAVQNKPLPCQVAKLLQF